jgi:DNA-binding NarL/FixJ family response regulator
MEKIKIAIVEDQHLFRQSLAALAMTIDDLQLIIAAEDGINFLEQLKTSSQLPEIALVDMNMPGMTGIELNDRLRLHYPSIKLMVLSVHTGARLISKMITAGACAYMNKNCDVSELINAIRAVHQTGFYINTATLQAIQKAGERRRSIRSIDAVPVELTRRETEVLRLICQEYANAEISQRLCLSIRTVEGHRNNLLLKTGCRNTAGLVVFAIRHGIYEVL